MTDVQAEVEDLPDLTGALFGPQVADEPHEAYARLLTECPVQRGSMLGNPSAVIARYEDVVFALRHPEIFSSADNVGLAEQPMIPVEVDPPRHTAYRRLLNPQFVPREIELLAPEVRRIVTGLIDEFAPKGRCDLHEDFATPLPSGIFLALMGLPREDLPKFLQWRDDSIRPDVEPGDAEGARKVREATARAISDYFRVAIEERRQNPDDSLLSRIVQSEIGGEPLNEAELLGMSHLLLLGGLDTVTATLDCMVAYLATHPEDRQRLADDPGCIPDAVEELLRFASPVMGIPRILLQDVELGGVQLRAGDHVTLVIGAANTDEEVFGPDQVDFDRSPNRHLAFGASHHLCLGAHLARLELRIALEELHRRIPDYQIAEGAEIHFSPGIRQANHLPLVFTPE